MTVDPETLKVYSTRAGDYANLTKDASQDPMLTAFIGHMAKGARVLDLGCGPGHASAEMARAGFLVDATDATPEMVGLANAFPGVNAKVALFEEIEGADIYDGIWANFSLLHAPKANMPEHLARLHNALKPGGLFHIGMKLGEGEHRDSLGRLYAYYTEEELVNLLGDIGFSPFAVENGVDTGLDGTDAPWVCIAAHA